MTKTYSIQKIALALFACIAVTYASQEKIMASSPAESRKQAATSAPTTSSKAALLNPEQANAKAPKTFQVRFTTTKGQFTVETYRDWSPQGADRFYNLVRLGYLDDIAFFRAIEGFVVQFGIHGSPEVSAKWRRAAIPDDPSAGQSNKRGTLTFATAGPNTRTTQFFINYRDNSNLDSMGFTPIGKVVEGMDVVDGFYKGYGDGAPQGRGPDQGRLQAEGNAYLKKEFPLLDYIQSAKLK